VVSRLQRVRGKETGNPPEGIPSVKKSQHNNENLRPKGGKRQGPSWARFIVPGYPCIKKRQGETNNLIKSLPRASKKSEDRKIVIPAQYAGRGAGGKGRGRGKRKDVVYEGRDDREMGETANINQTPSGKTKAGKEQK